MLRRTYTLFYPDPEQSRKGRHDSEHNDILYNDTQRNDIDDTQNNDIQHNATQHDIDSTELILMTLSKRTFDTMTPGACVIKLITAVIYLDSMVKP